MQLNERRCSVYWGCVVKYWPSTQTAIERSSAETEFCAAPRSLSEAKGVKSLCQVFGEDLRTHAYMDAQATVGIGHCADVGSGRTTPSSIETWSL